MQGTADKGRIKRALYKRKWVWIVTGVVAAILILVGPWPAYSTHFDGSSYARATLARVDALPLEPTCGPLRAGVAVTDITPPVGEPLAGYGGRRPKASRAVLDRLFAKAISLSNGQRTVTIVGGDILLVTPELRSAILDRVKLPPEEVYFTATHTHCGPGGYCRGWVSELAMGDFDEKILARLADAFAEVIRGSRAGMEPARVAFRRLAAHPALEKLVVNRMDQSGGYAALSGLHLLKADGTLLGSVVVFSPHPTVLDRGDRRVSGDYPGAVQRALEKEVGGVVLFAVGAVGSMGVAGPKASDSARIEQIGQQIASVVEGSLGEIRAAAPGEADSGPVGRTGPQPTVTLAAAILPVDLPPQQWRISEHWRVSPIAVSILHGRRSYIHVLRINGAVFLGMPADYSGELAAELDQWAADRSPTPVVTSFNGDYIGYLVPQRHYGCGDYEVRDMNFFGPWCGDYFTALGLGIMRSVADWDSGKQVQSGSGSR